MNNLKIFIFSIFGLTFCLQNAFAQSDSIHLPKIETDSVATMSRDSLPAQYDELEEFVFVQKKDLVTSDGAKLTYDMDNDDSSKGQNLLDALRKVPMVTVDGQDNIYIRGSQNFKIYVNGKEEPMLSANASRILKSMPAESVSKIEVITEPGAKYDAEGTGGILNLITERKQSSDGYMGSASLSYSSQMTSASLYGRFKKDKVTADLSLNYANNALQLSDQQNTTDIVNTESYNAYRTLDVMRQKVWFNYGNAALNLSWEPDQNNLFTAGGGINFTDGRVKRISDSRSIFDRNGILQSLTHQDITGKINFLGSNINAGYRHLFNDAGNSLTLSYRFNFNSNPWNLQYHNETETGTLELPAFQTNDISEFRREHIATIDYSNPIGGGRHKIEVGAKGAFRQNDRTLGSLWGNDLESMIPTADDGAKTIQSQNIYAAYVSYGGTIDKVALTAGIRYEHTQMRLNLPDTGPAEVKVYLNDPVPNAAVTYMFGPANNLRLAYQMRINRPTIDQLNPTEFRITQTMVQLGNPNLDSEHYNSVSLTYSNFGPKLGGNVGMAYYQSNNTIERYTYFKDGVSYDTYGNFGKNRKTELSGYLNWNISQRMSMSVNGSVNYTDIKSGDGLLHNYGWSGNYGVNYNYDGPWNLKYTAYGGQGLPMVQLQGKFSGWYYYGLSITKSLLKDDSLKITLNANNFLTKYMHFSNTVYNGSQSSHSDYRNRSWNVGITISWHFGHLKEQVKQTGADTQLNDSKTTQSRPGSGL